MTAVEVAASSVIAAPSGARPDCVCPIEAEGTQYEVRILDRACPRHGDDRPAYPGAPTRTRSHRTPVPAVKVQATSSFLPPLADLRGSASRFPVGAPRAVWVTDADGKLLHPMGQAVTTAQELAEQTVRAATLVEHGHGADVVVLHVGAGARDEELHVRALVEALDRTAHEPTLPGRGPSRAVAQ